MKRALFAILPACCLACNRAEPIPAVAVQDETLVTGLAAPQPGTLDWPWWHGTTRDGHVPAADPPLTWSESENVLWSADVGRAHASPCIWGDQLFLANADEQAKTQSLICFDRNTGDVLWSKLLHEGNFSALHNKNSHGSATPACDGQRVFAVFLNGDALWLTALDLDGELLWQEKVGPFRPEHGYGSSPVLYQSLVIVSGDNKDPGYLAAYNRESGKLAWRAERPAEASYSTPIVGKVAGRDQLLLHGGNRVTSYDPASGELLWECHGPADVCANTITLGQDHVYASGGYPQQNLLCIQADGSGDVTDTHITWKSDRSTQAPYVPTMLLHEGHLFVVDDKGILTCFDAATGEELNTQRLPDEVTASPLLADGKLFIQTEKGVTLIHQATPELAKVGANALPGITLATPAIVGDRIYIRTTNKLWCIGKPPEAN